MAVGVRESRRAVQKAKDGISAWASEWRRGAHRREFYGRRMDANTRAHVAGLIWWAAWGPAPVRSLEGNEDAERLERLWRGWDASPKAFCAARVERVLRGIGWPEEAARRTAEVCRGDREKRVAGTAGEYRPRVSGRHMGIVVRWRGRKGAMA